MIFHKKPSKKKKFVIKQQKINEKIKKINE